MSEPRNSTTPDRRRIVTATLIAAGAALLLFVAVVLPAEFGVDPLRTGNLLGLTALADSEEDPLLEQYTDHGTDHVEFVLEPFQSVEYKYLMDENNAMLYSWRADGPVYYDMHADPGMTMEGYDETFGQGEADSRRGVYVAPFTGIHGWFWENRSFETITIRLHSAGFYINSTVYQDGGTFERDLDSVFDTGAD